jgi:hypothetical protein
MQIMSASSAFSASMHLSYRARFTLPVPLKMLKVATRIWPGVLGGAEGVPGPFLEAAGDLERGARDRGGILASP